MVPLTLGVGIGVAGAAHAREACSPEHLAIDPAQGQSYQTCFIGKAVGQTFVAPHKYIRSISVYREEPSGVDDDGPPMKLWITRTGAGGQPLHDSVLLEGPTLRVPGYAAPPYKITWEFDPPFELPGPGFYAFFVQDPCVLAFSVLADTSRNVYPDGRFWRVGHETCSLNPAYFYPYEAPWDLIFDIEFCPDAATAVRRPTWGRLKTLYH